MTNENRSSGSSGSSSPDPTLTVNQGHSLTLAQFVAEIEATTAQLVERMNAHMRHRGYRMPVTLPQAANFGHDRFSGHGYQLVEDVAYVRMGRQRLSTHRIIQFYVEFAEFGQFVNYHY
uniref:Uncharacterized protein n=1 Tax=Acrobeloides nanus TaxID=290746 RepID=A0A914DZL4_9BILA